jgi:hypothetical protein
MLLGLLPDAPGSAAQRPALVRASRAASVSPVTPEDEGGEDCQGENARGKAAGELDQQLDMREGRRRLSRVGGSRSCPLTLLLQPAGTVGSRWRQKSEGDTVRAVSPAQAWSGQSSEARQLPPPPRRWGDLAKGRHQSAENHCTTEYRVVQASTIPTHRQGIAPARVWHIIRSVLAHGRATLRTWQQRRRERHHAAAGPMEGNILYSLIRCTGGTHSAVHHEKREASAMQGNCMRVTLALGLLVTVLHLAPQQARAEEATPCHREKAMTEAKTPAQYETMASSYDWAAATAHARAAGAHKLAATYRDLAMTGRSQFQIGDHYRQLEQYYERLAVDDTAHAKVCRQLAQAVAQQP